MLYSNIDNMCLLYALVINGDQSNRIQIEFGPIMVTGRAVSNVKVV